MKKKRIKMINSKKETLAQVFSCEFYEIFITIIIIIIIELTKSVNVFSI